MLTLLACGLEGLGAMSGLRMGLVLPEGPDLESREKLKFIHSLKQVGKSSVPWVQEAL